MSELGRPSSLKIVGAIGRVTFREIARDKVLYNILFFAFFLLAVSVLASRLTFSRQERLIVDFGMSAVNLSSALLAVLVGAGQLGKEFERRTFLVALSRPITKYQFVAGKFWGLFCVLGVNWLLLVAAMMGMLAWVGAPLSAALFAGLALLLVQSAMLGALAILFSSFSTTSLAVMISIGIYLIGNNVSQLLFLSTRVDSQLASGLLKLASRIVPNLELFNLGFKVTYGLPVGAGFVASGILYGLCVIGFSIVLAGALIRRREA